ncbi:hypothetical protein KAR91_23775 [Candidatus Pacearchaeota archaeon]|nr:hypothetical protein [Candidatus Pacearchaeota archaeon]
MIHRAYIGVDPGGSGAFTLVHDLEIDIRDWSSLKEARIQVEVWSMLYDIHCAAIERVSARSYLTRDRKTGRVYAQSQKGSSNFKFGENYGMWQGVFEALHIPYELVTPATWMGGMNLPKKINKSDKPALDVARSMYPGADLKFKKHHNRADSLLLADWLRRKHTPKLR